MASAILPPEILREIILKSPDAKTYSQLLLSSFDFNQLLTLQDKKYIYEKFIIRVNNKKEKYTILPSGKIHGEYKKFHKNGAIKFIAQYSFGKRNGLFIAYHKTGERKEQGKFEKDKKVGLWKLWTKVDMNIGFEEVWKINYS